MVYRLDELKENEINPITNSKYDHSWVVLILDDSKEHRMIVGSKKDCAYTIQMSKNLCCDWKLRVGDFIQYNETINKNCILVMSKMDYNDALSSYKGHSYNEPLLRKDEPKILVHSTTMEGWEGIRKDGCLKCWNLLKAESSITEDNPIGVQLGDLYEFSDYIMFGNGATTEIIVSSKLSRSINMDMDAEYATGARLYFDANRIASDGLLVRDGCHTKVKETLPLEPYLIWSATWDKIGLASQMSTPKIFSETADRYFSVIRHYNALIDENNDPVHDPEPLQEYMNKWDGQAFIDELQLSPEKSVLEIGVGTGRLAIKVAPKCGSFTGIDISLKTIERATENLTDFQNITLICDDFMSHKFSELYDVIYSSLTFMHIGNKLAAIDKIAGLLKPNGRLVISIDKNQDEFIDTGFSKVKVYPDNPDDICRYIKVVRLKLEKQFETEFAYVFVARKV